jgi:hypothetical protein
MDVMLEMCKHIVCAAKYVFIFRIKNRSNMKLQNFTRFGDYSWSLISDKSLGCLLIEVNMSTTLNSGVNGKPKGSQLHAWGKLEMCISLFMQFGVFGYQLPPARLSERLLGMRNKEETLLH